MGAEAVSELLIGVIVALFGPALVWSMVVVGVRKVLRRRAISKRPAPSESIEARIADVGRRGN